MKRLFFVMALLFLGIITVAEAQNFNMQFRQSKPIGYDTPVKYVPPPTQAEIEAHERECTPLTFVTVEEKPNLPLEMKTKEREASWKLWFTNFKAESRLRYLTTADILIIIAGFLIFSACIVFVVCHDMCITAFADGYKASYYSRLVRRAKATVGERDRVVIIYVSSDELDEIAAKEFKL